MKRAYLNAWDSVLRFFRRCAWWNPNYLLGVQIAPLPVKFISWYREPWSHRPTFYLMKGYKSGWAYTIDKSLAHRFDTKEEAQAVTPTYDGSANIERRTGVKAVIA